MLMFSEKADAIDIRSFRAWILACAFHGMLLRDLAHRAEGLL